VYCWCQNAKNRPSVAGFAPVSLETFYASNENGSWLIT